MAARGAQEVINRCLLNAAWSVVDGALSGGCELDMEDGRGSRERQSGPRHTKDAARRGRHWERSPASITCKGKGGCQPSRADIPSG